MVTGVQTGTITMKGSEEGIILYIICFFFSSRRRHTRYIGDWSSDVCSSDLLINSINVFYSTVWVPKCSK